MSTDQFADIHCHLLPGLDDGSSSWEESLEMARLAADDGTSAVIVTPHQLAAYRHIGADQIRNRAEQLQQLLFEHDIPLRIHAGADVRIEPDLFERITDGSIVSLADKQSHVLLELPHELYFPLEGLLRQCESAGIQAVLSHPERNQGLLKQPRLVASLVEQGCLMQVTAGSLTGTFGPQAREMAEWLVVERLVHFVASDAHGYKARRPLLSRAFNRVGQLADMEFAREVCCGNPARIIAGLPVSIRERPRRTRLMDWLPWRRAA